MNTKVWKINDPTLVFHEGQPMQVLRVGKWNFKDYGEVEVTKDDIAKFVSNFKAGVRRQNVPINIEHMHELGKIGVVKDMQLSDDGTKAYAVPEWTDKGAELMKAEAFDYTSPELYWQWRDDETQQTHERVVSGVAVTNTPRFKGMAQIAASESDLPIEAVPLSENEKSPAPVADMAETLIVALSELIHTLKSEQPMPEDKKPATPENPVLGNENVERLFNEMQTRLTASEAKTTELAAMFAETKGKLEAAETLLAAERGARIAVEISAAVTKAQREGRINATQAQEYADKLPKMDDATRALWLSDIASRPVALPFGEKGSGSESIKDPEDEQNTILAERADAIFAEQNAAGKKLSYRDALHLAAKETVKAVK